MQWRIGSQLAAGLLLAAAVALTRLAPAPGLPSEQLLALACEIFVSLSSNPPPRP